MDRRRSRTSSCSSCDGSSDVETIPSGLKGQDSNTTNEEEEVDSWDVSPCAIGSDATLALGVEEEEEEEDDEDENYEGSDFATTSVHHSPPATISWPPPIADNSNRQQDPGSTTNKNKTKPGIVYLSSIPTGFNVSRTTGFFSQYGRVGRIFLQPDAKEKAKRKDKLARNFCEGWVEFMSKRLAKEVAANLNLTQVGGKRRTRAHDLTWNIKYLPGFKWTHLSERLAYEKAVHQQRMRTEISQAKRESEFFKCNVDKSKRMAMLKRGAAGPSTTEQNSPAVKRSRTTYEFRQKETDDAIRKRKAGANDGESCLGGRKCHRQSSEEEGLKKKQRKASGSSDVRKTSRCSSAGSIDVAMPTAAATKAVKKSSKAPSPLSLAAKPKNSGKTTQHPTKATNPLSGRKQRGGDRAEIFNALM